MAMDEVTALVRSLLDERGWTVSALADRLGVHRHTVRGWGLGIHPPANPGPVLAMLRQLQSARVPKRRRASSLVPGRATRFRGQQPYDETEALYRVTPLFRGHARIGLKGHPTPEGVMFTHAYGLRDDGSLGEVLRKLPGPVSITVALHELGYLERV